MRFVLTLSLLFALLTSLPTVAKPRLKRLAQHQTAIALLPAPRTSVPSLITYYDLTRAQRYGIAHRLTDELGERIGVLPSTTQQQLTHLINRLLDQYPAEFYPSAPTAALTELLRTHTTDFQRVLAMSLPSTNYDRYVTMLDVLDVRAQ